MKPLECVSSYGLSHFQVTTAHHGPHIYLAQVLYQMPISTLDSLKVHSFIQGHLNRQLVRVGPQTADPRVRDQPLYQLQL